MANQLAVQQEIDLLSALDLNKNQIEVAPYTGVVERNSPFYNQNLHKMHCLKDDSLTNKRFFTSDGKSYTVEIQDNNYVLKNEAGTTLHSVSNRKVVMEKINLRTPEDFLTGGITPDEKLIYVKSNGDILKTGSDEIIDNVADFIKNYEIIKSTVTNDNHFFIVWAYNDSIETGMTHSFSYSIYDLTDFTNKSLQVVTIDFTDYKLGQTVSMSKLTNLLPVIGNPIGQEDTTRRTAIFWNFNGLVYSNTDNPLPIANGVWCSLYDEAEYPSLASTVTSKKLVSHSCYLFLYIQYQDMMYGEITLAARMLNDCYSTGNYPIMLIQHVYIDNNTIQNFGNSIVNIKVQKFGNVIANYKHLNNYVGPYSAYSFAEIKLSDSSYGNLTGSTFYMNGHDDTATKKFGAILINRGYGWRPNGVVQFGPFRLLIQGGKASECSDTLNDDNIMGISIGDNSDIGTLVTPWFFVDSGILPYTDEDTKLIFRGKDFNFYKITFATATANDVKLVNDSYFIFNTDGVKNMYDLKKNIAYHFASDWNNRPVFGNFLEENNNEKYFHDSKIKETIISINSGINANYEISNLPVNSLQQNNIVLIGADSPDVIYDEKYEISTYIPGYVEVKGSTTITLADGSILTIPNVVNNPGYTLTTTGHKYTKGLTFTYNLQKRSMWYADGSEAIDMYIGNSAQICIYVTSFLNGNFYKKNELASINYPVSVTNDVLCNPPLLFSMINSLINEYYIQLPDDIYKLRSYNTGDMLMLYNYGSGLTAVNDFFCISGQFYCIKSANIYIANYTENALVTTAPIVNVKNLQFIGTTPSTAYFYSSGSKKIFAFTGARELIEVQSCTKIESVRTWAYDPISAFLYIVTPDFVVAFNDEYSFKINHANISDLSFTEDGFILYEGPICYYYTYEKKTINGMTEHKTSLKFKTKFYGAGSNRVSITDCWYIKLYSEERKAGTVKIKTISLTNISTKSDEMIYQIIPTMWDENTNMYYLKHNPQLQRGMGMALEIESDFDINNLTCSVSDDSTIQMSKESIKTYISGGKI